MPKASHWAEQTALRILNQLPDKDVYTLASGITPSGTVHIGNFREVITVDLIRRALLKKGKKVRFLFSWDDYDVFRKIPGNMPEKEMLKNYLTKPIVKTPDPFHKENSYAKHHEKIFENALTKVGIFPEYIYQSDSYQNGLYASQMEQALASRKEIISILNQYRQTPLDQNWSPVSIFCESCNSNDVDIKILDEALKETSRDSSQPSHLEKNHLKYLCHKCGYKNHINLYQTKSAKLLWRVDWPMRWAYENVDFEPGGKDHSSDGGSYTTAREISQKIFGKESPIYMMYDFISIKGKGGKISSSGGDVMTLDDVLEIYEPEMIRYFFSSYRANVEFAISFDLDVIKFYEDYDRLERKYFQVEEVSDKKKDQIKWIYELAQIDEIPHHIPYQPMFRHLCNVLQIYEFQTDHVKAYYKPFLNTKNDEKKLYNRIHCAVNWLNKYAPEDFKFQVNKPENISSEILKKEIPEISDVYITALKNLKDFINEDEFSNEKIISEKLYEIINDYEIDNKIFFKMLYHIFIFKEKGPKLAGFMIIIGKNRVVNLLNRILDTN